MNIITMNQALILKREIESGSGRYNGVVPDETEMSIDCNGVGYLVSAKDPNCLYAKVDCGLVVKLMGGGQLVR